MVDLIVVFVILLYALFGIKKGFLRMFLEFVTVLVILAVSVFVYKATYNPLVTIVSFFVLSILFPFTVKAYFKRQDRNAESNLSLISRMLGCFLGIIWAFILISIFFVIIRIVPPNLAYAKEIFDMANSSLSFRLFSKNSALDNIRWINKIEYTNKLLLDNESLAKIKDSKEFQDILKDARLKAIAQDSELMKEIQNKNFIKVITNPKVIALFQDGKLLQRFVEIDLKKIIEIQD